MSKIFQVFHLTDTRDELVQRIAHNEIAMDIRFGKADLAKRIFEGEKGYLVEYQHVANVNADDLEVVFEKTNTIHAPWWTNTEVQTVQDRPGFRSTSTGDIVVDADGNKWFCAMCGWEKL